MSLNPSLKVVSTGLAFTVPLYRFFYTQTFMTLCTFTHPTSHTHTHTLSYASQLNIEHWMFYVSYELVAEDWVLQQKILHGIFWSAVSSHCQGYSTHPVLSSIRHL